MSRTWKGSPEQNPRRNASKCVCISLRLYALLVGWIAINGPAAFLGHFTVFVLACIIGYYVVWNVKHALHTPLMAITNAVSGIIVVGALLQVSDELNLVSILALISVLIASINIAGGFYVTKRMLKMFQK